MKKKALDAIDRNSQILSMGVDHCARAIYLFGDIDAAAAFRFVAAMNLLDQTPGQIKVYLNTPGGEIESGFAIFDAIMMTRNQVAVIGIGSVMSMGSIIMQAADIRLMTPSARFMIHTGIYDAPGNWDTDKMIGMGREMTGIRSRFCKILAGKSKLSEAEVFLKLLNETFFSADEALEAGFIDGVIEVGK
jgi:ATP-dependent Clp protease protease subunit